MEVFMCVYLYLKVSFSLLVFMPSDYNCCIDFFGIFFFLQYYFLEQTSVISLNVLYF